MLQNPWKKFLLQAALVVAALLLLSFRGELQQMLNSWGWVTLSRALTKGSSIFLWLTCGWLALGIMQVFVWPSMELRLGYPPPKLLKNIVSSVIILTVILSISGFVLNAPIPGLIAGSSVLAAIIGLAVTRMISDVFSGVALSVERAYNLGDWLEIEMRSRPGNVISGKVVEINWRATRLQTNADEIVVIPNSDLARTKFINFSAPEKHYRAEVLVPLSHGIPPERAKRILLAAVLNTAGVMKEPKPDIVLRKFDPRGVIYALWFYVNDYAKNNQMVKAVQENVLKHLQVAGIDLSYNRVDQRLVPSRKDKEIQEPAKTEMLKRISMFTIMEDGHLARIAGAMEKKEFKTKEFIVTQGEEGDSLFIIEEGLVNVLVKDGKGKEKWVAHIPPGGFFGEMALLTGEPRTASVQAETEVICYEIEKEDLLPIFQESPELLEKISEMMAARKVQLKKAKKDSGEKERAEETEKTSNWLLEKMRNFFGIKLW